MTAGRGTVLLRFPRHGAVAALCWLMAACGGGETRTTLPTGPDVTEGNLTVILERKGDGGDADGVTVSLWAGSLVATTPARLGDTIAFGRVPAGTYTVSLSGLDPLCRGDVADVVEVRAQSNLLRLETECAGRILYEKEFSENRVAVLYVDADSRLRTLPLEGRQHVRGTSPDGERALVEEYQAEACGTVIRTSIVTLDGGVLSLPRNPSLPVTAGTTWSPADGFIAGRQDGTATCGGGDRRKILLFNAGTGAVAHTLADLTSQVLGPDLAWSSDGTHLAFANANIVVDYEAKSGRQSPLYTAAVTERPRELAWAPNGRYLLLRPAPQAPLRVVDLTDGSTMEVGVAGASAAAWHPSGNLLAVEGSDAGGVFVFDVRDRSVTPATAEPVADARHPSWNAAGDRLLLSGRSPSGARALYVIDWPERSAWRLLEGDAGGPVRGRWARGIGSP